MWFRVDSLPSRGGDDDARGMGSLPSYSCGDSMIGVDGDIGSLAS